MATLILPLIRAQDIVKTANATVEGQGFYAAIIVENTNPMLEAIVGDFKQTAESLTGEKP